MQILLFNLAVVFVPTYFSIRRLVKRRPLELISARDNSNYLSSPRRSVVLFGKKAFLRYELFSLWRFRRYYFRLFGAAVSLGALFVSGIYISEIYKTNLNYPLPQYTIDYQSGFNAEMVGKIDAINGVERVVWDKKIISTFIETHILLSSGKTRLFSPYNITHPKEEGIYVTNSFYLTLMPPEVINDIINLGIYSYTGDLNSIYNDEKTIIISDTVMNAKHFKFNVGDKIKIAKIVSKKGKVEINSPNRKRILTEQLKNYVFEYEEYTIGAVINNYPSREYFFVGMNAGDFISITGENETVVKAEVYLKPDLSYEEYKACESELHSWSCDYRNAVITDNDEFNKKAVREERNTRALLIIISCIVLFISPLIWFLLQISFYLKRRGEFNVLRYLGAMRDDLRLLHIIAGVITSVLAFITSVILSYAGNFIVYKISNTALAFFSTENYFISYIFSMPVPAIIICALISVCCRFCSVYVSFILHKRNSADKYL